jgi:AraC-like DNA-binding protein
VKQATRFAVQKSWKLLILDMGYSPSDVLALARLPGDLFARPHATLSPDAYFDLWRALEQVAGGDALALKLAQVLSVEAFDPALFACLYSPDLNSALQRLAQYKRLIGPLTMAVAIGLRSTTVTLSCYGHTGPLPRSLGWLELVFFTQLARLATRQRIEPLAASCADLPEQPASLEAYLGCPLCRSASIQIAFAAPDARRPFLTENMAMWEAFEPGLNQRLSALDADTRVEDRVRAVLREILPAGFKAIEVVAQRLAMSKRSLQRHLAAESLSFQELLNQVRHELARHYLGHTRLSPGEIAWLLGFEERNSFVRAFRRWSGTTPAAFRQAAGAGKTPSS